jgi:hypothetical protein
VSGAVSVHRHYECAAGLELRREGRILPGMGGGGVPRQRPSWSRRRTRAE